MKIIHIITAVTFMLASSVVTAATIWAPTNVDTDFIELDVLPGSGISTNGGTLALFDDDDITFSDPLVIGSAGGQVVFTDNGGSWNAAFFDVFDFNNPADDITLTINTNFILGMDWGVGYFGDSNSSLLSSPDTYLIVFDGNDSEGPISGNTLAVDLAPIPVPAAAWLFGTGLLGLVAVARRRA